MATVLQKPNEAAINNAIKWGGVVYDFMASHGYEWRKPFISADEEGVVVLEWWYQDRNLILDITANSVTYATYLDALGAIGYIERGIVCETDLNRILSWLIKGVENGKA